MSAPPKRPPGRGADGHDGILIKSLAVGPRDFFKLGVDRRMGSGPDSSVRNLGFDERCQLGERFLPAEIAHFGRNDVG